MDVREIRQLVSREIFRKAQGIFGKKKVSNFEYCEGMSEDIRVSAKVRGENGSYQVELVVDTLLDDVTSFYCNCREYYFHHTLCKHCVAVLLVYVSKQGHNKLIPDVQLQTTNGLKFILQKKAAVRNLPIIQNEIMGKIRIEPLLVISHDGSHLEFKVGVKQMYIIKDIYGFLRRFMEAEEYSYGKKLSFIHVKEVLEENAHKYFNFIKDWAKANEADNRNRFHFNNEIHDDFLQVKELALSERFLELFIDCLGDELVWVKTFREEKEEKRVVKGQFSQQVILKGIKGGLKITISRFKAGFQCQTKFIVFEENEIKVIERQIVDPVVDFLNCILVEDENTLYLEEADIPAFCKELLPDLKKAFICESHDFDELKFIIEPPTMKVYLDMPQDDMITLRPTALYGEREYPVYDLREVEHRDLAMEVPIVNVVNQYSNAYDNENFTMVLHSDDDLLYEMMTQGISEMQRVAEVYISSTLQNLKVSRSSKVTVGVSMSGNLLSLNISAEELSKDEMIEILSKYDRKKKYYRLKDGTFINMDQSGMKEMVDLKEGLLLTDKQLKQENIEIPTYRAMFLDIQLKNNQEVQSIRDRGFKHLIRSMKTIEENDFEIPSEMSNVLREYQKTGFLWMKTLQQNGFAGILADDMGLGKTIQVIALLMSEYYELPSDARKYSVIITPASLAYNWKSEIEKFAPNLPAVLVIGTMEERKEILETIDKSAIFITSYDLLRRDIEYYENIKFSIQIIDEAQYIKNAGTQIAKAVKEIQGNFRLALTGTPVENRLSELWSIFDYLMPGFLYGSQKFRQQLEIPIVKNGDKDVLERLRKMVTPFILRRKKKDVLKDLPDKIEECRIVALEKEQQKLYDAHVKRLKITLTEKNHQEFQTSKLQILAELTKLRQICCDPSLLFEQYKQQSSKMELCIQLIQNAVDGGHKILLFSQFTSMLARIQNKLKEEEISFYSLTGSVSKEKRAKMVKNFNEDETSVFCISLKAGGTGLNLTSADIVIHFDPWWNTAVQDQATDRAHRIGQKQVVTVYKLITKNTIEEKIVELQERKKELADQILEGEGISSAAFTKDELMDLLSGK